ncbi:MAG: hypothetical protein J6U23_00940 [Clostridiales bacterium]|nr:hypothetical protein [Clostridiales bacterium]
MRKRTVILLAILLITLMGVLSSVFLVARFNYSTKHTMVYEPSQSEELLVAHDFGLILSPDIRITKLFFCQNREDENSLRSIRIEGVSDVYSFLTNNVNLVSEVTKEEDYILIDGEPVNFVETVVDYEQTGQYNGSRVAVQIKGRYEPDGTRDFESTCIISFFVDENGDLLFVECGYKYVPYGSSYSNIKDEHFWDDFSLSWILKKRNT